MKTLKMLGFGAVAAIGLLGTAAQADDYGSTAHDSAKSYQKQAQTALPGGQTSMNVTVQKVDKANNKIWFETEVSDIANKSTLDKLKPGDEVRASFDPATGEVTKIEMTRPTGQQPSKQPMKDPLKDDLNQPVHPDQGM